MNEKEFAGHCTELATTCMHIVQAKRPEYTEGNTDVLNNFKVVAKELGLTPLQVWYIYTRKHVASISQFCKDPTRPLSEPIESRFADLRNYLDLGYALVKETKDATN